MGTSTREATQGLQTQQDELIKQFHVYDAQDRLETVYTASYRATTGTPCTRVDYTYVNASTTRVEKMRESVDVWDASYDI